MSVFEVSSIVINGGTGAFARASETRVRKSYEPAGATFHLYEGFKWYGAGRVRDDDPRGRLGIAIHVVEYVAPAASLNQVDADDVNPIRCVKINILGLKRVKLASSGYHNKKAIVFLVSKASSLMTPDGETKLTFDGIFISGNHSTYACGTKFGVVRSRCRMGSRVARVAIKGGCAERSERLPMTDLRMTRLWISLPRAVERMIRLYVPIDGRAIHVPSTPTTKAIVPAQAEVAVPEFVEACFLSGEKHDEEMTSPEETRPSVHQVDRFVVDEGLAERTRETPADESLPNAFARTSGTNDIWLPTVHMQQLLQDLQL